ncbi:Cupin domain-containing protein [Azospirillaceae bacterium]
MATLLPRDDDGHPIPALRLRANGAHTVSVTQTSARNHIAFSTETRVIGVYATGAVFLQSGNATIAATSSDHYFPGGVYYDISLGNGQQETHNYLAAIRVDSDCVLYISEKE